MRLLGFGVSGSTAGYTLQELSAAENLQEDSESVPEPKLREFSDDGASVGRKLPWP